jgi:hypothetical protein
LLERTGHKPSAICDSGTSCDALVQGDQGNILFLLNQMISFP